MTGHHAEVAQDEERDHERGQPRLVERAAIADRLHRAAVEPRQREEDHHRRAHRDHAVELRRRQERRELGRHRAQDRVVGREVPHRRDVLRRLQRIGRNEVVVPRGSSRPSPA